MNNVYYYYSIKYLKRTNPIDDACDWINNNLDFASSAGNR